MVRRWFSSIVPVFALALLCGIATPATPTVLAPNSFQLKGPGGVKVSYSTTSIDGRPLFHFVDGKTDLTFRGDDVRSEATGLGTVVSVTIALIPDVGSTEFSILIPTVNLVNTTTADMATLGIWTNHRVSLIGPTGVPGQADTYDTVKLAGTASNLVF